jgi:hypothetical protein
MALRSLPRTLIAAAGSKRKGLGTTVTTVLTVTAWLARTLELPVPELEGTEAVDRPQSCATLARVGLFADRHPARGIAHGQSTFRGAV